MVNCIKCLSEINLDDSIDLAIVNVLEPLINLAYQACGSRMARSKSKLVFKEKLICHNIVVQLFENDLFENFTDQWEDRDRPVIIQIRFTSPFMDGGNSSHFPLVN